MLLHPCNKNIKKWMKYKIISHNQIFFFSYLNMSMYERTKGVILGSLRSAFFPKKTNRFSFRLDIKI